MVDMMGFDFEEPEAVRQEAAKPPLQPSPSKQPARKPAKVAGHCFCGETQEPKNGYCARHKRAYECIWRQYVGKNCKISEEAEIFYTIFGDVKRARQFPGKPDLAEEALMDFVEEFPEAANGSSAKRGETNLSKYFHQTGTRVSKDDVSTHMKMDWELFSGKMKLLRGWEKEESRRHWRLLEDDPTVAEDMKGVKDSAGRPTKRLAIPPTYFGGDSTESRSSQYEDKSMIKESKPMTNLDDDTFAAYLAECRKGFKDTSQQDVAAMMQETFSKLGRSSLTGGTGLKDAIAMMMNSLAAEQGNDAQQQPQQQPQTQPEGGSNPQPQQQQQHEQQQGGPAGSDDPAGSLEGGRKRKADLSGGRIPKKVDISRKRTEATNSWKREFDTLKNKVISVVDAAKEARSSANAALDGDFLGLMADRQLMAELWLGNAGGTKKDAEKGEEKEDAKKGQEKGNAGGTQKDAEKGEEKDAESQEKGAESQEQDAQSKEKDTESKEKGAESQGAGSRTNHAEKEQSGGGDGSGSSQAAFTKFITSLKLLPVESPDQILVLSAIMDRVDDLRSCEDEAAILLIAAELGAMKELINQMCVAVRAVVKSLVSNRQRRERQAEKDLKKNAEKRTADGARQSSGVWQASPGADDKERQHVQVGLELGRLPRDRVRDGFRLRGRHRLEVQLRQAVDPHGERGDWWLGGGLGPRQVSAEVGLDFRRVGHCQHFLPVCCSGKHRPRREGCHGGLQPALARHAGWPAGLRGEGLPQRVVVRLYLQTCSLRHGAVGPRVLAVHLRGIHERIAGGGVLAQGLHPQGQAGCHGQLAEHGGCGGHAVG